LLLNLQLPKSETADILRKLLVRLRHLKATDEFISIIILLAQADEWGDGLIQ
jgi:hypothetical protein